MTNTKDVSKWTAKEKRAWIAKMVALKAERGYSQHEQDHYADDLRERFGWKRRAPRDVWNSTTNEWEAGSW